MSVPMPIPMPMPVCVYAVYLCLCRCRCGVCVRVCVCGCVCACVLTYVLLHRPPSHPGCTLATSRSRERRRAPQPSLGVRVHSIPRSGLRVNPSPLTRAVPPFEIPDLRVIAQATLASGMYTSDISPKGTKACSTTEFGDAVAAKV